MSKTKLYFLEEEDKAKCAIKGKPVGYATQVAPLINKQDPFSFKVGRHSLSDNWHFFFQLDDGEGTIRPTIIFDGAYLLPYELAKLVKENGWFCLAIRSGRDESEEVYLAIYYENDAYLEYRYGELVPGGVCSSIHIFCDGNNSCYRVAFNGRQLDIWGYIDYPSNAMMSGKRINSIDFEDNRGIQYLCQCLAYQAYLGMS